MSDGLKATAEIVEATFATADIYYADIMAGSMPEPHAHMCNVTSSELLGVISEHLADDENIIITLVAGVTFQDEPQRRIRVTIQR